MHPNVEQHWFIKTSFVYGVEISFYYDDMTKTMHAFSSNGVSCKLIDFKDIHFYKNNQCVLKTVARSYYVNQTATIDGIMRYLEYPIFFHVSDVLADKIFDLLKDKHNISFILHPKEMLYFFSYSDGPDLEYREICIMQHDNEFYFSGTDFVDIHRSFFSFVQKYSICIFAFYKSLETDNLLFVQDLDQVVVNMTYTKSSQELFITSKPKENYKTSLKALDELVPEETLMIAENELQDYVYRYFYDLACKNLKPMKNDEYNLDLSADYKDVLKLVDMIRV
jgi:hypothetical protein